MAAPQLVSPVTSDGRTRETPVHEHPIYADYAPTEDGWVVLVTCAGHRLRDVAEGDLVAARDTANALIATIASTVGHRPVVHLLDGDALAFTGAYLSERLGIPVDPVPRPATDGTSADLDNGVGDDRGITSP